MRTLFCIVSLLLPAALCAQTWQALNCESFESLARINDGSLLVIRYPGDILHSTDTGVTWHEAYHGLRPLSRIVGTRGYGIVALGDGRLLRSIDSGRVWRILDSSDEPALFQKIRAELPNIDPNRVDAGGSALLLDDSSNVLLSRDGGASWRRVLRMPGRASGEDARPTAAGDGCSTWLTRKLLSIVPVDSVCFALGEQGLMYVSDSRFENWRELHFAPFGVDTTRKNAIVSFSSARVGAIADHNNVFITEDSGTTWRRTSLPDTSTVLSFMWMSDTSAIAGTSSGGVFVTMNHGATFDTVPTIASASFFQADPSAPPRWPVRELGWRDPVQGEIFILTDSSLSIVNSEWKQESQLPLPLASGERATAACFMDKYTVFLLARDTFTVNDTLRDTSFVSRSQDGGSTWVRYPRGIPGATAMSFASVRRGFVTGANGAIVTTDDTGNTWSGQLSTTRQRLRAISFLTSNLGFCVGDSGVVLTSRNEGRWWRPSPPVPLITHPAGSYSSLSVAGDKTVYIVGQSGCYRQTLREPMRSFRFTVHMQARQYLTVTVNPNPARSQVRIRVSAPAGTARDASPTIIISDLSGRLIQGDIPSMGIGDGLWQASADCSSLSVGTYEVIATAGNLTGRCNLAIEH